MTSGSETDGRVEAGDASSFDSVCEPPRAKADYPGALDGVRVVDLTTVLMGPFACRMLADHGADVIRIEDPASEAYRTEQEFDALTSISLNIHRNKRRVGLDLKSPAGATAARAIIDSADVVVSNMRAAALERLGIDAATLRAGHPELIHCVANGYGADGPHANRPAYDDAIQALSGLAAMQARLFGEPMYLPSAMVDKVLSLHIVQAVMAALLHQRATGEGQTIQVPMFETMVAFNLVEHLRGAAFEPPRSEVGYDRVLNPARRPYRCADGEYVCLLPYATSQWRSFFDLVGQPELVDDPRFATHNARMQNVDDLYGFVAEMALLHSAAEWVRLCDERSIPANLVLDLPDLFDDEHLVAVDLFQLVEHPTEGAYRSIRDAISYSATSTALRHHAARPGAHTAEVLQEFGLAG